MSTQLNENILSPEELARSLDMEVLSSIALKELPETLPNLVPYVFVHKHLVLPIKELDEKWVIAIADPLNLQAIEELRLLLGTNIEAVYAPKESIVAGIAHCYHQKEGTTSKFLADLKNDKEKEGAVVKGEIYDLLDANEGEAPIIRLLNLILAEAIQQGASDIHFEPFEQDLKIRYRIDGVLQQRHSPSPQYQGQLLTRIKVLAGLDIAEHRLPQDGRIKLSIGGREVDLRVSTIPVSHGERIVLRILDRVNVVMGLDHLGFLPSTLDEFRRLISIPEGIVLVTGPTGSGKTSTLYSVLSEVYTEERNILTVEDPVEYKFKGVGQISVHPKIGLTFAAGLRHILRQDPDVVMIGEIRDQETAEIAIQASMTGHLVFSTLHTNDAPSAIPRLMDMGIEPYLLSSTIAGVLAQRLVRRVCPNCREPYSPTDEELEELDLPRESLNGGVLYKGKGCSECYHTGYKGRHGIYELFLVDHYIQSLIAKGANSNQLREAAVERGLITLRRHGAHLVRCGVTTTSEVLKTSKNHSREE
jgi:general secretion pathway protein E